MKHYRGLLCLVALGSLMLAACGQAASPAAATQPQPAAPTETQALPASPIPTVAPTAPAADASALVGRFFFAGDSERVLDLAPDGSAYWPDNYGSYTVSGNQVTFADSLDCTKPGSYEWLLDGTRLTLRPVADPCAMRANHAFTWLIKQPALPYVVVQRLTHGQELASLAVGPQGSLYATKQTTQTVEKYGPDGTPLATLGGPGTGNGQFVALGAAAVDSQGNLYVSDLGGLRILKFDTTGKHLTNLMLGSLEGPGPLGLAVDRQDNLYVALNGHQDHYVEKWSADGKQLATWGSNGTGDGQFTAEAQFSGPRGITVDFQGNVYVTDPDNNRVQKFDSKGQFLFSLTGNEDHDFAWPFSVAVDGAGTLYVLDGAGQLFAYDAAGKPLGLWLAPWASTVRIDAAGSLFMIVAGDIAKIELPTP
jgi:sugar lactone lactonase YvrE